MRVLIAIVVLVGLPLHLVAQSATNISYSAGKDSLGVSKYFIVYDLKSVYPSIPCKVSVKITIEEDKKEDRSFYLKDVTGDVGELVYPGDKKTISWDYVRELVHFTGKIGLEVEVKPSVHVPEKIKKGKTLAVEIANIYEPKKTYAVKLYRGQKEVERLNDILLIENKFTIQLPRKVKKKGKYQIALLDGDKIFYSNTFKVKPKVGYGWKALAVMIVPAYLMTNKYIEDNKPLPGPPTVD